MNNFDKAQISVELSRLIARQTEFFQKSDPTPSELQEFEWAGERMTATDIFLSSNNLFWKTWKYVVCFVVLTAIAAPIARSEPAY